jgi:hypothetical protein
MNNSMHKTIGDLMAENRKNRKEKLEKRLDEIENWMIENAYTHPDFQKYVEERNYITTQLNII